MLLLLLQLQLHARQRLHGVSNAYNCLLASAPAAAAAGGSTSAPSPAETGLLSEGSSSVKMTITCVVWLARLVRRRLLSLRSQS